MRLAWIRRFALGALAASVLAPAEARSEDFTFTVPVAVRDLPSFVHGGGVRCEVLKSVPPPPPAAPAGTARSSGESAFSVAHGSFQGNVTVRFNATAVSPGEAKGYRCWLYYLDASGRETPFAAEFGGMHRAGTPYTPEVRGAVNP